MKRLMDESSRGLKARSTGLARRGSDRFRRAVLTMATCMVLMTSAINAVHADIYHFVVNAGEFIVDHAGAYLSYAANEAGQALSGDDWMAEPDSNISVWDETSGSFFSIISGAIEECGVFP